MTTPLQYILPDGTTRVSCPDCGAPCVRAVGGLLCLACGRAIDVPSVPGPCRDVAPVVVVPSRRYPTRSAYRDGRIAAEALVQARLLCASAHSVTGAQCEAMAQGLPPHGSQPAQSIPARLDPIGDLAAAFGELPHEDQLLLELDVMVPDWKDNARRCRECHTEYPPASARCSNPGCRHGDNPWDAAKCERCGSTALTVVWGGCPAAHEVDDTHRPDLDGETRCGCTKWSSVAAKASRIATETSARRESVWRTARGGKAPSPAERRYATLCPACDSWASPLYEGRQWHHREECPDCGGHVRLGMVVEERQIGGLLRGAIYRWERLLRGRGLMGERRRIEVKA